MKKLVRIMTLAAAVTALPAVVSAQDKQFNKDSKVVNVGLLVANEAFGGMGLGAGLEIGVAEIASGVVRLGVGGSIGYLRKSYGSGTYLGSVYGYKVSTIPVVVFVNGHYQIEAVPKLDVYAGPVVGMAHRSYSFDGDNVFYSGVYSNSNEVAVGVQAGARYELTSAIAGQLQLSGGSSALPWINIGVAFKF